MEPWSLPKARPISCNDSPAFQRRHMSVLCSAESLTRLPCVINTTFRKMIHIRWCCIDRLNWHRLPGSSFLCGDIRCRYLPTETEGGWTWGTSAKSTARCKSPEPRRRRTQQSRGANHDALASSKESNCHGLMADAA